MVFAGVNVTLMNTTHGQILTFKRSVAKLLAVVTYTRTPPLQYTIKIWQSYALVLQSTGNCGVNKCTPTKGEKADCGSQGSSVSPMDCTYPGSHDPQVLYNGNMLGSSRII
ncbi:unnamed protein product [Rotaria socialis]|uniref:Uncharacterized protein n=2 Tax=Rotaria socialis TaxID=392032 RepID=A0A821UTP1_9BILA|nr:unnamed protein product [Rotaria socialis]